MLQAREHFLKEETARHLRSLFMLHQGGECTRDSCPHCLYETQFASQAERQAWEEHERELLFRSHFGG